MKTFSIVLLVMAGITGITFKDRLMPPNKATQEINGVVIDPPTFCDDGLVDWTVMVDGNIAVSVCAGKDIELDLANRMITMFGDNIFKDGFDSVGTLDDGYIVR